MFSKATLECIWRREKVVKVTQLVWQIRLVEGRLDFGVQGFLTGREKVFGSLGKCNRSHNLHESAYGFMMPDVMFSVMIK